jgi:hypothetical protein
MSAFLRHEADAFRYEACDVPPGMTLTEFRSRRRRDRRRSDGGLIGRLRLRKKANLPRHIGDSPVASSGGGH